MDITHQGVPAITVIVDGGWSKRSHCHSYNAKSSVGIIIGQATGKAASHRYQEQVLHSLHPRSPPDQHTCYRNWDMSSSEREADIILEGFKQVEQVGAWSPIQEIFRGWR